VSKQVLTEDGQNITEGVQILYDIAHSSMDWGSGFLDNEEMETVIRLAILMGWRVPDLPDNSPAIATVARQFPDHYEVEVVTHPAHTAASGYAFPELTFERIKVKS
jgi:hypothetical protein